MPPRTQLAASSSSSSWPPARRPASRRQNPFQAAVREVSVKIETGKLLRILSTDLDAPAQEIADIYKRRWPIELFFRRVKQTLRIRPSSAPARTPCASRSPWR